MPFVNLTISFPFNFPLCSLLSKGGSTMTSWQYQAGCHLLFSQKRGAPSYVYDLLAHAPPLGLPDSKDATPARGPGDRGIQALVPSNPLFNTNNGLIYKERMYRNHFNNAVGIT